MDERLALLTLAVLDVSPARAVRIRAAGLADVLDNPEAHADLLCEPGRQILRRKRRSPGRSPCDTAARSEGSPSSGCATRNTRSFSSRSAILPRCCSSRVSRLPLRLARDRNRGNSGGNRPRPGPRPPALGGACVGGCRVISGLARGIDAAAHRGALDAGGPTVGVLGGGFDRFYPPENLDLGRAMIRRGAIVSEFPLAVPPHAGRFPQRNRVIAGLCRGLVVVEAPSRSGALVTARLALEAGREVMAVPGFPGLRHTEGTNELLRDGATLIRHAADVAASLGLELVPEGSATGPRGGCLVQGALTPGVPYGLEEIRDLTGIQGTGLLSRLSELELQGVIRRLPGARYVLGTVRKSS